MSRRHGRIAQVLQQQANPCDVVHPQVWVALAEQAVQEGRPEQAQSLLQAAYDGYDALFGITSAPEVPKEMLADKGERAVLSPCGITAQQAATPL